MKYLIAGLGNIGSEYEFTRHNAGFLVLDELAANHQIKFDTGRYGDTARFKLRNKTVVLLKPSTYMNLSGNAIRYWLQKEKIPIENLLVITDDIALPLGTVRLRTKGSHGGHNGLTHIQETLSTSEYNRLRIGVGNEFPRGGQVGYVLGKWTEEEQKLLPAVIKRAAATAESVVLSGTSAAMNLHNSGKEDNAAPLGPE